MKKQQHQQGHSKGWCKLDLWLTADSCYIKCGNMIPSGWQYVTCISYLESKTIPFVRPKREIVPVYGVVPPCQQVYYYTKTIGQCPFQTPLVFFLHVLSPSATTLQLQCYLFSPSLFALVFFLPISYSLSQQVGLVQGKSQISQFKSDHISAEVPSRFFYLEYRSTYINLE